MGVSDERDSWRLDDDDAEEYEVVFLEQLAVVTCMFICEECALSVDETYQQGGRGDLDEVCLEGIV